MFDCTAAWSSQRVEDNAFHLQRWIVLSSRRWGFIRRQAQEFFGTVAGSLRSVTDVEDLSRLPAAVASSRAALG
jgi:hypothetical protein